MLLQPSSDDVSLRLADNLQSTSTRLVVGTVKGLLRMRPLTFIGRAQHSATNFQEPGHATDTVCCRVMQAAKPITGQCRASEEHTALSCCCQPQPPPLLQLPQTLLALSAQCRSPPAWCKGSCNKGRNSRRPGIVVDGKTGYGCWHCHRQQGPTDLMGLRKPLQTRAAAGRAAPALPDELAEGEVRVGGRPAGVCHHALHQPVRRHGPALGCHQL